MLLSVKLKHCVYHIIIDENKILVLGTLLVQGVPCWGEAHFETVYSSFVFLLEKMLTRLSK